MKNKTIELEDKVSVRLDVSEPYKQKILVTLSWYPLSNIQKVILPIWTPGSYTIRDHSQYLHNLTLSQSGEFIPIEMDELSQWKLEIKTLEKLTLSYFIEAHTFSVRTSYVDSSFASISLAGVVAYIHDRRYSKYTLELIIPSDWNSYVPLYKDKYFEANNYDLLVDAPVVLGKLEEYQIKLSDLNHKLVLLPGTRRMLPDMFISHIEKLCEHTSKLLDNRPPSGDQYIFYLFLTDNGYGGLEHDNSTVLQYSMSSLKNKDGYRKLLQLIAHEYLHQWNIRRLRPKELSCYNYTKAVIFDSLWFAEGVTSYFDLIIPFISGISTLDQLFKDISYDINIHFNTPGRMIQSLAMCSRETWIKLYKTNPSSINYQVSYYRLGLLVSLCLDIQLSYLGYSLSDLLRYMWLNYSESKGYTNEDIINYVSKIDDGLGKLLHSWIYLPDSLEIEKSLMLVGLKLNRISANKIASGINLYFKDGRVFVKNILSGSPADNSHLCVDDEIISIAGIRIDKNFDFEQAFSSDLPTTIIYSRRGFISELTIEACNVTTFNYEIIIDKDCSNDSLLLRDRWLKFFD